MSTCDKKVSSKEDVFRRELTELGYIPSGALAGNEFIKENEGTCKTIIYHMYMEQLVCTHETRLLSTGSRIIQVHRMRGTEDIVPTLKQLDKTVVAY